MKLLGPAEIRALAADLGLRPTKTLGQNFLHDPNTIRRIVRTADLVAGRAGARGRSRAGSLTLGPAGGGAPRHRGRDRPGARDVAALAAGRPARSIVVEGDAMRVRRSGRTDRAGGEPAVQRGRAGRAASARECAVVAADSGHGAGRSRRPAGRAAGFEGLRRAVGEGCLVRVRPARRRGVACGVLARPERRLCARPPGPARPAGDVCVPRPRCSP